MKKRLFFLITYFLFWVIYFVITKIVFLLYHYRLSAELDLGTILLILVNGLKLDLSFTAYISVIPFFIISLSYYLPDRFTKYSITLYTIIILILVSVLTVIDLELYTYWEYRLDATMTIRRLARFETGSRTDKNGNVRSTLFERGMTDFPGSRSHVTS